jgi:WhiB family redox-sensing transcriptional regulator
VSGGDIHDEVGKSRADTAPSYRVRVNVTEWLMSAPNAPVIPLTLEDLIARPAWHSEAACVGQTDLFFVKGTPPTRTRHICRECPVQAASLQYALADPDLEGVWAGTTAKERRVMRRSRVA